MSCEISEMVGLVFVDVVHDTYCDEKLIFRTEDTEFIFYHKQECCEDVYIEDICGNLSDLVGSALLMAEKANGETEDMNGGILDWTFYKFATRKEYVDVRWCGKSSYYSTEVSLEKKIIEKGVEK